jgi:polygalacturonase
MKRSLNLHRFSMKKIFLLTMIAFLSNASVLWSATRNVVTGYGADNTGTNYATANIQNAINACAAGDILLIPAGTYLMNDGLDLKSNITVIIATGALVKANTNYVWVRNRSHMFYGLNVTNVTITGGGTIDGGGLVYERGDRTYSRPGRGIEFVGSSNLKVTNLRVQNIPNFAVDFNTSTNIIVDKLVIRGRGFYNNSGSADGLDVVSCSNVVVTNCDIEVGDDALCIKSDLGAPCHNLRFYNCIIASTCNAFKIGTNTVADVYDVIADGIIVNKHSNPGTGNPVPTGDCISAIAMQSNDNANVHDITVRNFTINSTYNPISFLLENRQGGTFNSNLQNILIENINCKKTVTQPVVFNSVCSDVNKIKNITLKNITVSNYSTVSGTNLSCMGSGYPEVNAYGIASTYGIWARKLDGLQVINCNFINSGLASRPRTYYENTVSNVSETTGCTVVPIDPFLNANNTGWKNVSTAAVPVGGTISLGPQPTTAGTWSWSGPNGYTSNTREITISNLQANQFGTYTATYINSCGGQNSRSFTIANANIFQAENAAITNGTINNGSTGQYVDVESGGKIVWAINAATSGSSTLSFNVGVPAASTRKMGVYLNGTKIGVITSSLIGYAQQSITATLNQGNNVIELADSEGTTELNVDYLSVSGIQFNATAKKAQIDSADVEEDNSFYIFPNPVSNGILNIEFHGEKYNSLSIFNNSGNLVYSKQLTDGATFKADLSSVLKTGIYIVSLKSDSKVSTKKLIVK